MKIIVDTREQCPYKFEAEQYAAATVETAGLATGDYSLRGFENQIALERKSLDDLAQTLTAGRDRFSRECQRGRGLAYFALVIESSLEDIKNHRYKSKMTPQALLQSLAAFSVRYGLHVIWAGSRQGGEYLTFSILQKFLREQERTFNNLKLHFGG